MTAPGQMAAVEGRTMTTAYGDRITFEGYERNGAPAHDEFIMKMHDRGMVFQLDPAHVAQALNGIVPGLTVSYTPVYIGEETRAVIDAARAMLAKFVEGHPDAHPAVLKAYRAAVVDMTYALTAWAGSYAPAQVRGIIESEVSK
ncbi:MAG: hypothetical protein K0S70_68 [Microbacterium sp.]|jgi:hypothetical protein|nr:hypothetical protein [Microbacterium sp.]